MTSIRAAKSKGSQFEYDCQASLKAIMSDIYRTAERGFQMQFDLHSEAEKASFECKRLKGISWNQLLKFYQKLAKLRPDEEDIYLLFKSNHQPCLVFTYDYETTSYKIQPFEAVFETPFIKHESTRAKK